MKSLWTPSKEELGNKKVLHSKRMLLQVSLWRDSTNSTKTALSYYMKYRRVEWSKWKEELRPSSIPMHQSSSRHSSLSSFLRSNRPLELRFTMKLIQPSKSATNNWSELLSSNFMKLSLLRIKHTPKRSTRAKDTSQSMLKNPKELKASKTSSSSSKVSAPTKKAISWSFGRS